MDRAAKALAEKNERDLQLHREQEERHRISEALDREIERWASGKDGKLRELLSTLQHPYLSKKEYRRALLCIHPDKVQQQGANLQQKYISEKVFDHLKKAWDKFNSEETF